MLLQLSLTLQFFYLLQISCSAAGNEKHISCTRRRSLILRISLEACFCVFQVVARDDDQGANGQLSYMLSGGNDEGAFSLSSSGQLSLTQTLDREAQGKYILLITATDSGETAGEVLSCEGGWYHLELFERWFMLALQYCVSVYSVPKSVVYAWTHTTFKSLNFIIHDLVYLLKTEHRVICPNTDIVEF